MTTQGHDASVVIGRPDSHSAIFGGTGKSLFHLHVHEGFPSQRSDALLVASHSLPMLLTSLSIPQENVIVHSSTCQDGAARRESHVHDPALVPFHGLKGSLSV